MKYRINWKAGLFVMALGVLSAGCGRAFAIQPPKGFVELNDQSPRYDFRAVNADHVVISARAIKHDPKGDLAFWKTAIEKRLRDNDGYAKISEGAMRSADGMQGVLLKFGRDQAKVAHEYWVTVYVSDSYIFLLEAGGTREEMAKNSQQIQASFTGFQAD